MHCDVEKSRILSKIFLAPSFPLFPSVKLGCGSAALSLCLLASLRYNHAVPDCLATILLGIIEGVTEFLPVSSTGHLLIAQRWLEPRGDLFNSVVQCGAVLAVVLVFWGRIKHLAASWRKPETRSYIAKLALAFLLTAIGGLALKASGFKQQDEDAGNAQQLAVLVAWVTLVGGVIILLIEQFQKKRSSNNTVTWTIAIVAALAQLMAVLLPGTSRSAATILSAMMFGLARPAATEFSFLLGVPTLLSAGSLQLTSAIRDGETIDWGDLILGVFVATITAFITVKWLIGYVQTHTFNVFGWYRIALGVLILVVL